MCVCWLIFYKSSCAPPNKLNSPNRHMRQAMKNLLYCFGSLNFIFILKQIWWNFLPHIGSHHIAGFSSQWCSVHTHNSTRLTVQWIMVSYFRLQIFPQLEESKQESRHLKLLCGVSSKLFLCFHLFISFFLL